MTRVLVITPRDDCAWQNEKHADRTNLPGNDGKVGQPRGPLVTTSKAMLLKLDFARFLRECAGSRGRGDDFKNVV